MEPSRRKFLRFAALGGIGVASLAAVYLWRKAILEFELPKKPNPLPVRYGVEHKIIIPGCAYYDIDSMSLPGKQEFVPWYLNAFRTRSTLDPKSLNFGADFRNTDLYWQHMSETERQLVPEHGAERTLLKKNFDEVTLTDLVQAQYSSAPINGSDNNDQMPPGTIIGIKTKEHYAKMRIDGFLPSRRKGFFARDSGISKYHLECTLLLYKSQGQ